MIGRVLEQSKALCQVLSEDRKTRHLVPTWQDTDVLESVNNALGPLQEFTDALSGEDYVSVSYLKPVLHLRKTATLAETDQRGVPGRGLCENPVFVNPEMRETLSYPFQKER